MWRQTALACATIFLAQMRKITLARMSSDWTTDRRFACDQSRDKEPGISPYDLLHHYLPISSFDERANWDHLPKGAHDLRSHGQPVAVAIPSTHSRKARRTVWNFRPLRRWKRRRGGRERPRKSHHSSRLPRRTYLAVAVTFLVQHTPKLLIAS